MLVKRKLRFGEVITVSKICKDLNIIEYIEKLSFDNPTELGLRVAGYLIQNMCQAETSIKELIMSYSGINEIEFNALDLDQIFDIFKAMYDNGLPNIIKKFFDGNNIDEETKKKLLERLKI